MLDPLETKQIYGSNPTKLHHTNKSEKNWAIFGGEFLKLGQINKIRLEKEGWGLQIRDQPCSDTKMM